jgi:tRNA-specific adenosine deaminase 1
MASINDGNQISKLCLEFYEKSLKKNGKPTANEWTILAAIVVHFTNIDNPMKKFKILSLATGSKCLPSKDLPNNGINCIQLI